MTRTALTGSSAAENCGKPSFVPQKEVFSSHGRGSFLERRHAGRWSAAVTQGASYRRAANVSLRARRLYAEPCAMATEAHPNVPLLIRQLGPENLKSGSEVLPLTLSSLLIIGT